MKNKLIKISFLITILGILILIILSIIPIQQITPLNKITNKDLNKQVKIQGEIINIRTINPDFHILTIKDSTFTITATTNNKNNLNLNQTITLAGKVTNYKNQLQIQVNNIKK